MTPEDFDAIEKAFGTTGKLTIDKGSASSHAGDGEQEPTEPAPANSLEEILNGKIGWLLADVTTQHKTYLQAVTLAKLVERKRSPCRKASSGTWRFRKPTATPSARRATD